MWRRPGNGIKMKIFQIEANGYFHAEDIDDAFKKLSAYFLDLSVKGLGVKSILLNGKISIKPTWDKDDTVD